MKKRFLQFRMAIKAVTIALLLGVMGMMKGYAYYSFSNVCPSGQTLYYLITDATNHYVELTHPGAYYWEGFSKPTGNITLPTTVECNGITYTVRSIGEYAFRFCSDLSGSLVIPNTVTSIGDYAFDGCYSLYGSLTISNSIQNIGEGAFSNCWFSTVTSFPNSLVHIGSGAFYGLEWYWNQPDGLLYLNNWCLGYKGNKPVGNLVIQANTKGISDNSFSSCPDIVSVNIPYSLLYIGDYAFYSCSSLETITVDNSVLKIGERAFSECHLLTSANIGNSVTTIGDEAFCWCTNLESINFPNTLTSLGRAAFCGCSNLASVIIPNSLTTIQEGVFSGCSALTSIMIPNSVTVIGSNAFWGCEGLTSIDIPNSVTSIEMMAFGSCTGFTSITIPNSVVFLGDGLFRDCTNLSSVYVGSSVSSIEGRLFEECSSLVQIVVDSVNSTYDSRNNCNAIIHTASNRLDAGCRTTIIPNTVMSIGYSAFIGCRGLTSMEIPNSVTFIHAEAFSQCSGLVSINIPSSVTGIDFGAFMACTNLATIDIPNSVTSIGDAAFSGCIGLTSIEIPNSVTSLGNQLFEFCENLTSVSILNSTPPTLGYGYYSYECFPSSNEGFTIYVPYESLETYKTAANWSEYESYIQPMYYTTIQGYGTSNGNWRFIASPLAVTTAPTMVENMITTTEYDLYQFNQSANDGEWQNYKANNFNLLNGQGYLYANAEDVNLIFKGEFNEEETKEIVLAYDANANFAGWNLVGNPFPVSAYANKSYYVMNEEGSDIEPVAVSSSTAIAPCTGVMVKAEGTGESVTFSKTLSDMASNQGNLQITMRENTLNMDGISTGSMTVDKVIVSFNAGDALEKFVFNFDNAQLSIKQDGKDYAIVCAEKQGEMPLNFKAAKNGNYTLVVNTENMEMDYLHLIDNLTGRDIDLLAIPDYTFEAKTSDYASRFKLVYMPKDDVLEGAESFSYYADGRLVIPNLEGVQIMQVVDMLGRIVMSESVTGCYDKQLNLAPGVYVVRLNERTQKIVVE